jgi:mannose-6-phosphate isomerase-like protein (cupin superfamily)
MLKIFAALLVFSAAAAAQTDYPASYISREEIQAATKGTAFRIVDVGNAYVGVFEAFRPKRPGGGPDHALMHSKVTEVYIITAGSATLATGGMMTDLKPHPPGDKDNGEGIGPGFSGTVAKPNAVQPIKAGDVIVIPRGTPHWFAEVQDSLTYLVVRVDPEKTGILTSTPKSQPDAVSRER